jgi:hypothetical protein
VAFFDVSREWVILSPGPARTGADELARCLDQLRTRAGLSLGPPVIGDAAGPAPPESVPVIILNAGDLSGGSGADLSRNGFSWRLGRDRLEIYGDSLRGLFNGIFDFLAALGIGWPEPDREKMPPPARAGLYPLKDDRAYGPSAPPPRELRRLIIDEKKSPREIQNLIRWAARNKFDALVFSLGGKILMDKKNSQGPLEILEEYSLILEAGGWDLSLLAPRRFFLFHRDLFRMESGKRTKKFNFCPTNPETISLLKEEAARRFTALFSVHSEIRTLHLWPDRGHEKTWCSCPACRAFTAEEQNRIAVNAAADILADLAPEARLSLYESSNEETGDEKTSNIPLRPNVFTLEQLPGKTTTPA